MILRFPDEIKQLKNIYLPYIVDGHVRNDAPQEAKDAFKKEGDWIHEQYRKAGME